MTDFFLKPIEGVCLKINNQPMGSSCTFSLLPENIRGYPGICINVSISFAIDHEIRVTLRSISKGKPEN